MPTPKFFVFGDWDKDGDFSEADSDITSDVQHLKWTRGKNVAAHRAEAAVLELKLTNSSHKYTPTKAGTTLVTAYTKPDLWLLIGYPVDDFVASNGTTLGSRKPSHDSLFAAWAGDTGDVDIQSNKARTATGANKSVVLDFGEKDCWVGCKYTRGGTTSGLIVRWTDASNYLLVYHDGTNIRLGEVVSGTLTSLAFKALAWSAGAEKWIFVELHGNEIRVMVDRALQFTHTTTRFNAVTRHGIGGRATHADDRWSDFGGWVPKFFGTLDTVQPRPEVFNQYAYIRAFDDMARLRNHMVYRTAPAVGNDGLTYPHEVVGEILDAANAPSANRIIDDVVRDSNQGTVTATGTGLFRLDDDGQDFGAAGSDWTDGTYQIVITDDSGTTATSWIGTSDVDTDGTRIQLYTDRDLGTLGYLHSDSGFSHSDTPLTYVVHDASRALTTKTLHEKALGRDALTEIYQVADDDVGFFYIDGFGNYRYESNHHRKDAAGPHFTARAVWYEQRQDGDEDDIYFSGLEWDDGKDRVENEIYYAYHRIARVTGTTVWSLELDDNPEILNDVDEGLDFLAIGEGDVVANPITPLHVTDFTMNTLEDGSGTNLLTAEDTHQGSVTANSSAFWLDDAGQNFADRSAPVAWNNGKHQILIVDASGTRALAFIGTDDPDGNGTKVNLFNSSALDSPGFVYADTGFDVGDVPLTYGVHDVTVELVTGFEGNFRLIRFRNYSGSDGFITYAKLRADKGTASHKTAGRAELSRSQVQIGRHRVQHNSLHIDRFGTAKARASERLTDRAIPLPHSRVEMQNATKANLMQILHRGISDRVQLSYTGIGIANHQYIERQTVQVTEGGMFVDCTWDLVDVAPWLWDWALWKQSRWG